MFRLNNNQAGLSVKFSSIEHNLIGLGSGDNFGIVGRGMTTVLEEKEGMLKVVKEVIQENAVLDIVFSEEQEGVVYSALGNGTLVLDNLVTGAHQPIPLHLKEINTFNINNQAKHLGVTSSNDRTAKVVDLRRQVGIDTLQGHEGGVQESCWHPINSTLLATVCQDSFARLWDVRGGANNIVSIRAHDGDVLTCDFNKYQEQLVTAGTDRTIRLWDLRNLKVPVNIIQAHRYPIKKVRTSPHHQNIILTASYDMQVNVFDVLDSQNSLKFEHKNHTEFVLGIDFSLFDQMKIASTSYDGSLRVWNWDQQQP